MYQIYQVMEDETINSIANKLKITEDELRRINGIGDNATFREGSYIIIPNQNLKTKIYIVKQGDNLYKIARENNIDYDTIMRFNGLKADDYIYPGEEIMIPTSNTYIVKENETVKDIISKTNIDSDKLNDLYLIPDQIIIY